MPLKRSKRSGASTRSSKAHRVDAYAADVVAERVVAGPLVRLACARHQRDRAREGAPDFPYRFDRARADHVIQFFEQVLRLPDVVDDDGDPVPFLLQPWQAFVVGSLFGWVDAAGYRRFREAYIEIGKGNGKTPMCAGIGLYGLVMDGERAAEIYAAAADQDQASILFRDAFRIAQASPDLWAILKPSGGDHIWQLEHKASLSFFRMFSREGGAKSGTRPHIALLDELHEHGSPQISIKVRAGAKRRKQPLFVEITNSGYDRASICWQHHEHSQRVLEGVVDDAPWFAYVCALDEGDDPLTDEACWAKANPNLGVSIGPDYLRRQVANARHIPAETNTVLRLNFCVWTQANTRAIDLAAWHACQPLPPDDELLGEPCFGGLDLGQTDDLSAFVLVWVMEDGRWAIRPRFWLPRAALDKYPNRPYAQWQRDGTLTVTDGDTTDYDAIEHAIAEACRVWGVREVGYDKRFAEQMAQHLVGHGITMVDTPQGAFLNESLRAILKAIADGTLCHGRHPVLSWMAGNVVTRQMGDRIRLDKEKSPEKIDGFAAMANAVDRIVRQPVASSVSIYETRGLLTLGAMRP